MKTILLVEDDPFLIDIYSRQLQKEGFKVDIAVDGQMALDKITNTYPDLLLLDLMLPKMNGWEVLKKARINPKSKNVKVVIISNLDQREYADAIKDLEVLKYFLKISTTPKEIAEAIKEILK